MSTLTHNWNAYVDYNYRVVIQETEIANPLAEPRIQTCNCGSSLEALEWVYKQKLFAIRYRGYAYKWDYPPAPSKPPVEASTKDSKKKKRTKMPKQEPPKQLRDLGRLKRKVII